MATVGTWTSLTLPPPSTYMPSGLASIGDTLYGILTVTPGQVQTWAYDTANGTWSQLTSLPELLVLPSVTAVGGLLFAASNMTQLGHPPQHWFYSYDPSSDEWTALPDPPSQSNEWLFQIAGATLTVDGATVNQLVVFSYATSGTLLTFDLGSQEWSLLPSCPGWTNNGANITMAGSQLCVFATSSREGPDIALFDFATQTWTTRSYPSWMQVPPATSFGTAVSLGNFVFWPNVFRLTVQYDLVNDVWYQQQAAPMSGTPYLTAGSAGANLYALTGGPNGTDASFSVFGLPNGVWASQISRQMQGQAIGWAFAVAKNGVTLDVGGSGFAVASWEQYPTQFTPQTGIIFASCSKTITATAAMAIFQNGGSGVSWPSLDAFLGSTFYPNVSNVIPNPGGGASTSPAEGVDTVTIGELLTMKSGMWPDSPLFTPYMPAMTAFVQHQMEAAPGTPKYINNNFSLQLLISEWLGSTDPSQYVTYVQNNVLQPMGITDMQPAPFFNTLTYSLGQTSGQGQGWGQLVAGLAAGGWCGTVADLLAFAVGLQGTSVLSQQNATALLTNYLGCYPWNVYDGEAYFHNGGLLNGAGQGLMTMWMLFPDGTAAAWVCNTWNPPWYSVLPDAYNAINDAAAPSGLPVSLPPTAATLV